MKHTERLFWGLDGEKNENKGQRCAAENQKTFTEEGLQGNNY